MFGGSAAVISGSCVVFDDGVINPKRCVFFT
jgi:hypothetical protein